MAPQEPRSLEEAADWLRKRFRADASGGLQFSFEFDLAGPRGGKLCGQVADGSFELETRQATNPDVRFRVSAEDFFAVLAGRENPEMLMMADRISIDGNLSLAIKVRSLFRASSDG